MSEPNKSLNLTMFRTLRHRQFLWMWGANLFSNFGTSTYVLAINWIAVKEHGGIGLGAITLAYGLSQFIFQLFGGVVSDRFNRKVVFVITESSALILAVILALFATDKFFPIWFLALMNGLNGAISAFDTPARTTLINELVPVEDLVQAQQLYGLAANTTSILGPALGGLLLGLGDTAIAFWFNAFSFIPVLISLLFIHAHPRAKSHQGPSIPMLTSIVEGLGYVRQNEQVRTLILLMSIIMILGMPYQTLLPMFAHKVLHAGSSEFAALSSAVGLGGFLGTLMTTNLGNNPQSGRWLFYTSLMFGLFIFLFVESPVIHWAALSVCLAGACSAITLNLDSSLIQSLSPETFRGRMTSISGLNKGALSISAALAGYASHYFGMVSIQIIFIILMVVSLLWLSPHLSKINQATLVAE